MNPKTRSGWLKMFQVSMILPGLVLLSILGLLANTAFRSASPQDSNNSTNPLNRPPSSTPTPDSSTDWKNFSENRPSLDFSLKYPRDWGEPFDHCNRPPTSQGFGLSPTCIKIVIITENLPDENADSGRDLVLSSTTDKVVSGFRATRKLYTLPEDASNTPDTYELWIYDNGRPFMVVVAWIGSGTDQRTATQLVRHVDRMVNTLQLRRH